MRDKRSLSTLFPTQRTARPQPRTCALSDLAFAWQGPYGPEFGAVGDARRLFAFRPRQITVVATSAPHPRRCWTSTSPPSYPPFAFVLHFRPRHKRESPAPRP